VLPAAAARGLPILMGLAALFAGVREAYSHKLADKEKSVPVLRALIAKFGAQLPEWAGKSAPRGVVLAWAAVAPTPHRLRDMNRPAMSLVVRDMLAPW
jgi:hypothetical protein